MDEKVVSKLTRKDLEPGIIDDEMISTVVLEGYKGEAGRLARMDKIDLSVVSVLRLEFQKILKIDHLWVMPNLKILSLAFNKIEKIENLDMLSNLLELNLCFNYIEKVENLEKLSKLEILGLYGNKIVNLENIDELESLLIFSVGDNKIETYDGIERLRFLNNLRSFNMEGNPIAKTSENPLRIYIAAFLPNLKYYNYALITEQERTQGRLKYKHELRELEEREKTEIKERELRAKEREDEIRLSECFVEYLNGHQLFDSLFVNDPEGDALMSIENEVNDLKREYREEAFRITQQIYKIGLEQHKRRKEEIQLFEEAIKTARETVQEEGITMVTNFVKMSDATTEIARKINEKYTTKDDDDSVIFSTEDWEEHEKEVVLVREPFKIEVEKLKKFLMEIEVQLYESVEEANGNFEHIIQDFTNEFIELVQAQFVLLRDAEVNFNEVLSDTVQRHATQLLALAADGSTLPKLLNEFMVDKEYVAALAMGTRDLHMQRIDAREDKLITRCRTWVKELNEKLQRDEVKRNRTKIQEIIYFIQNQRDELDKILDVPQQKQQQDDQQRDIHTTI